MGNENGALQQRYGSLNDDVRIRSRSISQERLDEDTKSITQCFKKLKYSLETYFKFHDRDTNWCTELKAGFTDFVTMAYILAVNASILKQTGGTCGQDNYSEQCLHDLQLSLITATAISSAISTALMGIIANLPIALAPGMGMNAYFFTVVGQYKHHKADFDSIPDPKHHISYERALAITCMTGSIFLFLVLVYSLSLYCCPLRRKKNIRRCIEQLAPFDMKKAITFGIGLFLALIGFKVNQGIGIIASAGSSTMSLGWNQILGIIGFVLMMLGTIHRCKPSILLTILLISQCFYKIHDGGTIWHWPEWPKGGHAFGACFEGFKQWDDAKYWDDFMAVVTFLIVDILDTTGALYIIADYGKFSDNNVNFTGSTSASAIGVSAIGTIIGALCGTSPVTPFVESAAGIQEGGKTGITAIVVSLWFIISLFFAPMFVTFPSYATGPVLIVIGALMIAQIFPDYGLRKIFPVFIIIICMPYLYSIGYGIVGGILTKLIIVITDCIINFIQHKFGPFGGCKKYIYCCCCCDNNNNHNNNNNQRTENDELNLIRNDGLRIIHHDNDGIMDDNDDDDDDNDDIKLDIDPNTIKSSIQKPIISNITVSTINDNDDIDI